MNFDIDAFLKIGVALASIVILIRVEPALSQMTSRTHGAVRFAIWLLAVGSLARLVDILIFDHSPDFITLLMMWGSASLLLCERRLRVLTRGQKRYSDDSIGATK